ncbi:MAG: hypothetical protein IJV91_02425, partial [Kiritimatiellae bacterium]|nr:hypothetical protein [Kiritimatiellia bacterium]
LVLEWLEKGVGETPQNLENFQTFITEKVVNDIRDLEASTSEALLNRPTKIEMEAAIAESEERMSAEMDGAFNSILESLSNLPVATVEVSGTGKLATEATIPDTAGPVGMTANGAFAVPFATDTQGGVIRTGGNGVGLSNNVLVLNLRTNHSGLNFQNRGLYVNVATNDHPTAGTVEPVGTDTNGRLCVPGIKIDTISRKAEAVSGVLTSPVLIEGRIGVESKVLCSAITNQASTYGYYGTLENLGCASDSNVFITALTLYRRSDYTGYNVSTPVFLRVLRAVDGAWTVAYESTHTLTAADFAENDAMTWNMANKDGRGAIPSGETIAIVQVHQNSLIASSTIPFGCKTASISGSMATAMSADPSAVSVASYAPAIDITFCTTVAIPKDSDVVHKTGEETIAGPKKFTSSINIGGKTLLEVNVGAGVLKFSPVGSTAQTVIKRDGTNVVI